MQPKMRPVSLISVLLIAAIVPVCCTACGPTETPGTIEASGTIEAEEIAIASEFGGKVREVLVDEGDEVEAGQVLIQLETDLVESQVGEAEAALGVAQANLDRVQAGARPGERTTAQATLDKAIAARDGAQGAWQDAVAVRNNPQELEDGIDEARTRLEQSQHGVDQARAYAETLRIQRDEYFQGGDDETKSRYAALDQQVKAAEAGVAISEEQLAGATADLENLLQMRDNPIALNAKVNEAKARYEDAVAAVSVAEANLNALLAKPSPEEVAVAEAQVRQAEAALGMLKVQLEKLTLHSPISGLVSTRSIHEGETASAGATLMTVADLNEVKLTVYIPEDRYGRIQLGQAVDVGVDSFPGKIYRGRVVYIASRAEFTPRNVQTEEERVNTVFAVKILIPNPERDLKPGMPADATIVVE